MTASLGEMAPDAVLRLAAAGKDGAFLGPHHVEAARLLTRLFERSRLRQRVTMSYDPTRLGGKGGAPQQGMLADSAADARKRLNMLARALPADCWTVLTDICAFDKGLQQVETERAGHGAGRNWCSASGSISCARVLVFLRRPRVPTGIGWRAGWRSVYLCSRTRR